VEAYATVAGAADSAALAGVAVPEGGRILERRDAAHHLVSVATGRDSVVLGEDQVLHQLREALEAARASGALDTQVDTIMTPWWSRIIVQRSYMKGWKITPSHYLNQDLSVVWIDK
jgi:glutamyl-tRNA reductase